MDAEIPEPGFSEEPSSPERSPAERRNWADLPTDCLSVIFRKIGAVQILTAAQSVCRSWRQLSLEPQLWRCIDMTGDANLPYLVDMEALAREAVDRSHGHVEAFWARLFVSCELLQYLADRANILKSLRLIHCYKISSEGLTKIIKRFPQLEELDISYCQCSKNVYESVGQACPKLKSFGQDKRYQFPLTFQGDPSDSDEAFAVANNMPELRHLQIFGNKLANAGLHAILDKCPHLESLDVRECFNISVDGALQAKFARIKNLRLPADSIHDYEYKNESRFEIPGGNSISNFDIADDYDVYLLVYDYIKKNAWQHENPEHPE